MGIVKKCQNHFNFGSFKGKIRTAKTESYRKITDTEDAQEKNRKTRNVLEICTNIRPNSIALSLSLFWHSSFCDCAILSCHVSVCVEDVSKRERERMARNLATHTLKKNLRQINQWTHSRLRWQRQWQILFVFKRQQLIKCNILKTPTEVKQVCMKGIDVTLNFNLVLFWVSLVAHITFSDNIVKMITHYVYLTMTSRVFIAFRVKYWSQFSTSTINMVKRWDMLLWKYGEWVDYSRKIVSQNINRILTT